MVVTDPFAALALPANAMQVYVALMVLAVIAGTLYDIAHKGSATYFFDNWRRSKRKGSQPVDGAGMIGVAVKTVAIDVLASGEFCNARRRVAHLLTMYGFVLYVVATAIMVFGYPTRAAPAPAIWPLLWWIGALMIAVGGWWFWFFIRVDVAAEGRPPMRLMRADLFVLSLATSATLGLIWAYLQVTASAGAVVAFVLYIIATTVLFGSVAWSKFAHMFFKPAAAFEKRMSYANGTRSNLPAPAAKPERFGRTHKHARHY